MKRHRLSSWLKPPNPSLFCTLILPQPIQGWPGLGRQVSGGHLEFQGIPQVLLLARTLDSEKYLPENGMDWI